MKASYSSLKHIAKARLNLKFGIDSSNEEIRITKQGQENDCAFVELSNGKILWDVSLKSLITDVYSRYVYSHYEIDHPAHKKYGIHMNHTDNLLNLQVDENTRKALLQRMPVKKGDTVLELGAYRGFGTIKLSELVGSEGKVIAVEADKTNFEFLKRNITSNNIQNVIPVNKGIWNKEEKLALHKEKGQRNSLVEGFLKNTKSEIINVYTVDHIISDLGISKFDFVTMEINGAEIEALEGMRMVLNNSDVRLVSAGWYKYKNEPSCRPMKDILEKLGFRVFIGIDKRVYALKNLLP